MADQKISEQQEIADKAKAEDQAFDELDLFAPNSSGEIDESSLDLFLEKQDGQFVDSLKSLGEDKELIAQEIILSDLEQELADEITSWQNSKGLQQVLFKILPFLPRFSLYLKKLKYRFFQNLRSLWVRFKNFSYFLVTDGRLTLFKVVANNKKILGNKLTQLSNAYVRLSRLKKVTVFGLASLMTFTGVFIFRAATVGVIKDNSQLFIPSIASVADESYDYDPTTEAEPFYENLRATQNIFLLPKIVVNIKRGLQSGPNPMGAFEFFVEGMVPEVIVEMKDREAMLKDAIQRVIEDFSFDQLESSTGKAELRDRIKKEVNTLLTKGTVKRVLIKTIVLKP